MCEVREVCERDGGGGGERQERCVRDERGVSEVGEVCVI